MTILRRIVGIDFLALADGQSQLLKEIKAKFELTIDPEELAHDGSLGKRLIAAARPDAVAWLRHRERAPEFLLALDPKLELAELKQLDLEWRVLGRARHVGNRERHLAMSAWLASRGFEARLDLIEEHDGWAAQVRPSLVVCERASSAQRLLDAGFAACAIARPDNFGHVLPLVSSPFEIARLLPQDESDEDALSGQSHRSGRDDLRGLGGERGSSRADRRQGRGRSLRRV